MSKSLGNLVFVSELRKTYDPRAIRLGISAHHYRDPWEWNDQIMPTAAARLEKWLAADEAARAAGEPADGALEEVRAALDNDLDTPAAIAAIDAAAERGQGVADAAMLLGVDLAAGPVTLNPPTYEGRS